MEGCLGSLGSLRRSFLVAVGVASAPLLAPYLYMTTSERIAADLDEDGACVGVVQRSHVT